MPVVLVIIIVAAWVVILGPSVVKRRSRSGGDQSISHFHQQLRILEQRAPDPIVAPAYRLRAVDGGGTPSTVHYPAGGSRPVLTVVGAKELPRPALAFLGDPAPLPTPQVSATVAGDPTPPAAPARYEDRLPDDHRASVVAAGSPAGPLAVHPHARAVARRRRRDTLAVLGAVFAVTVLAGAVTGSSVAWAMAALDGVALTAYVALLVHLRRIAVEREHKLHYLDPLAGRPARPAGPPAYVSGRYAHPSNQQAVAR